MFLVMLGYEDPTQVEHVFARWFASGIGLIIISMGEFEVRTRAPLTRTQSGGMQG